MQGAQNFVCPEPSVELDAVVTDSKEVKEVSTAKLLGLTISANLTLKKQLRKLVSDYIS